MEEQLVSRGELAKRIGFSKSWVAQKAKYEGLPQHGPPGAPRYRISEVMEWLDSKTKPARAPEKTEAQAWADDMALRMRTLAKTLEDSRKNLDTLRRSMERVAEELEHVLMTRH